MHFLVSAVVGFVAAVCVLSWGPHPAPSFYFGRPVAPTRKLQSYISPFQWAAVRHATPAAHAQPSTALAGSPSDTEVEAVPGASSPEVITGDNYDELVADGNVVVYFTAKWCGPCKQISPAVKLLAQRAGLRVFTYDLVTGGKAKAKDLGIRSIPYFILYKGGVKVSEFSTINPDALEASVQTSFA